MAAVAASAGLNLLSTAGSTYASVEAQKAQANFQRSQLELNARMADIQAKDAISRGDKAAADLRGQTKRLIGSQRTALAAQGINIEGGSAADVQADTAASSAVDELTIKNNAYREAFGYRAQALNYGNQAAFTGIASNFAQKSTILTAGMQFAAGASRDYANYDLGRATSIKGGGGNYAPKGSKLNLGYDKF